MAFPAAVLAYTVALVIKLFHETIYKRLYWPILLEAKRNIDNSTGEEDEYFDYQDLWEKLDEYHEV